jgi:hypothetical protein
MTASANGIALGFDIPASASSAYGSVRRLSLSKRVINVEAGDKCLDVIKQFLLSMRLIQLFFYVGFKIGFNVSSFIISIVLLYDFEQALKEL